MKNKLLLSLLALAMGLGIPCVGMAAGGGLTDADVGDAESFGKRARWLGLVQTGAVYLADDCAPYAGNLGPDDRCVALNPAPALTSFDFPDLARITLPGNSTGSLICHWATPLISYRFANTTGADAAALFTSRGTYRIESVVLEDPSLINPVTGAPFAGGIDVSTLPTYRDGQNPLAPNASQDRTVQATRACIGGLVSTSTLMSTYGLTEAQAKQFFKNPITIRAGLAGQAKLVSSGQIIQGTRFTGDDR